MYGDLKSRLQEETKMRLVRFISHALDVLLKDLILIHYVNLFYANKFEYFQVIFVSCTEIVKSVLSVMINTNESV